MNSCYVESCCCKNSYCDYFTSKNKNIMSIREGGKIKILFVEYPKCSTCQKAKKWLDANEKEYTDRHIKDENPTAAELKEWHKKERIAPKEIF